MEIITFALIGLVAINGFLFFRLNKIGSELNAAKSNNLILQERARNYDEKLQEQNNKIVILEDGNNILSSYKGRFGQAEELISYLRSENENCRRNLENINHKIAETEKVSELLKQQQEILQKEKQEWSKDKEIILYKLSEELAKKNSEEQEKIGLTIYKDFEKVINKLSSMDDDLKKTIIDTNLTKNALLNPGGAGRTSEITLENILKSSGLKEKINVNDPGDFILQAHFVGHDQISKRPDAIVFLPGNHLLIIDSKSSSHFLDLQQAIDAGNIVLEKEIMGKIRDSMRKHLEDLRKKDYAKAKLEELGLSDFTGSKISSTISTVMFLQTEKMLEIVRNCDPTIEHKALEINIPILSPIGLINYLTQAKILIDRSRQEENIAILRIEIEKLINAIGTLFLKSEQIGKSLGKSLKSYNEFVGTFNKTFLMPIKNMSKLGVKIDNKNSLRKLSKVESEGSFIEGEMLELEENPEENS